MPTETLTPSVSRPKPVVTTRSGELTPLATTVTVSSCFCTVIGRIATLSERVKQDPSPLEQQVRRVAWLIAVVSVGLAGAFIPVAMFGAHLSLINALVFAAGLLAGMVPEGLLPVITLAGLAVNPGLRELGKATAIAFATATATLVLLAVVLFLTSRTNSDIEARLEQNDGWLLTCEHLIVGPDLDGSINCWPYLVSLGADPASDRVPAPYDRDDWKQWLERTHQLPPER